jgi:hypothetical protein
MNTKKGSVSRRRKVSNCRNLKSASVKLYSLPKEGVRRNLWLERMNYIIDTNLKNLFVCSDHFLTGICSLILTIIDYYLTICHL